MREVLLLIGPAPHHSVLWSDASFSPLRLPDSRARWEAIWSRRTSLVEVAHSHPVGPRAFSREDETTMRAIVSALGRGVMFSVVAPGGMIRRFLPFSATGDVEPLDESPLAFVPPSREPWWTSLLRLASGMKKHQ